MRAFVFLSPAKKHLLTFAKSTATPRTPVTRRDINILDISPIQEGKKISKAGNKIATFFRET